MKLHLIYLILFCASASTKAQIRSLTTKGDNSPAVIANKISMHYGINPTVVSSVLSYYSRKMGSPAGNVRVESLFKEFTGINKSDINKGKLSKKSLAKLRIQHDTTVRDALEWQLFTTGNNSPAIFSSGTVEIWYDIPQPVFRKLLQVLEGLTSEASLFKEKWEGLVSQYKQLQIRLSKYDSESELTVLGKKYLSEGLFQQADSILQKIYHRSQLNLSESAFTLGLSKLLQGSFPEAFILFYNAIDNDPKHGDYRYALASTFLQTNNLDSALSNFEIAYYLYRQRQENDSSVAANLISTANKLGIVNLKKDSIQDAIRWYRLALFLSYWHDTTTISVVEASASLGNIEIEVGDYAEARNHIFSAISLSRNLETSHRLLVANIYDIAGEYFLSVGQKDSAKIMTEKSYKLRIQNNQWSKGKLADIYLSYAAMLSKTGFIDSSLVYFNKALELKDFIVNKVTLGSLYASIGSAYNSNKNYERAKQYLHEGLSLTGLQNDDSQLYPIYSLIAGHYKDLGIGDSVIYYSKAALNSYRNSSLTANVVIVTRLKMLLSQGYFMKGRYIEACQHMDSCQIMLENNHLEKTDFFRLFCNNYSHYLSDYASIETSAKNFDLANSLVSKAFTFATLSEDQIRMLVCVDSAIVIAMLEHKFDKALTFINDYITMFSAKFNEDFSSLNKSIDFKNSSKVINLAMYKILANRKLGNKEEAKQIYISLYNFATRINNNSLIQELEKY